MNLERVQKYYELIDRELGLESNDDLFGFESEEDDLFGFDYADEGIKEIGSKIGHGIRVVYSSIINILVKIINKIQEFVRNRHIDRLVKSFKRNLVGHDFSHYDGDTLVEKSKEIKQSYIENIAKAYYDAAHRDELGFNEMLERTQENLVRNRARFTGEDPEAAVKKLRSKKLAPYYSIFITLFIKYANADFNSEISNWYNSIKEIKVANTNTKLIQNWYNKISSVWTEGFLITPHDVLNTQVTNDSFFDRMGNSLKKWFVCVAMLARKLLIYIKRKQFNNNDKPEDAKDLHETIKRLNITMASHIKTISILGNINIWKGVKDNTPKVDNTITDDKLDDYNVI